MPQTVVFVHGYGVRSLSAYSTFPALLVAEGMNAADIRLSAFDTLDNSVTCDDLARALGEHVATLEAGGLEVAQCGFAVHSTGAIVARRWMLDRLAAGQTVPSHFISLAGANHGSALAQLGVTAVNRLRATVQGGGGVGQQVLTDLDFGSAYLRRLNADWLAALERGALANTWTFSMIGDDHSALEDQFFWQTHENGSDCTVRICAGNLNYSWLDADPDASPPLFAPRTQPVAIPHLVLHGWSHIGKVGVFDGVRSASDAPFAALMQAFRVTDKAAYDAVRANWAATTTAWNAAHPDDCGAMLIFRLTDESGRPITDNLIVLADQLGSVLNLSASLQKHQPIQNNVDGATISFYVRYAAFTASEPHTVHIEARSGSPLVDYRDIDYTVSPELQSLVRPNEVTYIDVKLKRDVRDTYRILSFASNPDFGKEWPPLPN